MLTTAGAITVMALLVQWNLSRGFRSYINLVDQERISELAVRFAREYQREGSWDWARHKPAWQAMTRPTNAGKPRPRPGPPDRMRAPPPDDRRFRPDRPPPPPRGKPAAGGEPPPTHVGPRVSLFDANENWVAGPQPNLADSEFKQPIEVDAAIVGWLTTQPIRQLQAMRDVNFLQQQSRAFSMIALLMLLTVAVLAYFLARHLTRPLTNLTQFVQHLASGNYASQLPVQGRDEIADLTTNVNALANALQDSLHARQRWVADISHELRTPLAILQGEIEALRDGVRQPGPKTIESLHTEVLQLGRLVDDLHDLSLSDAGALTYQFRPTDIGALMARCLSNFTLRFEQHGLSSQFTDAARPIIVLGDERRLEQLFSNLLENSVRYTDAPGTIKVQLQASADTVVIEIADSAPSVSPPICARLFERFYRPDDARSRASGGSGLGLAIASNIVQAHQGRISAAPSSLGGLAITIELPVSSHRQP